MGKMLVYHGSFKNIETPKIHESKHTKDFGPGFYCTVLREQAERWAKRYDTENNFGVLQNSSIPPIK
ncbi:MAG: DUF3990 domain-containing protein [Spirochaetaceae bacterium]|nr:DUF3990 domain-containing protein [Spirochaetaceae bacterium]